MSKIITRAGKGSPLTYAEMDANFSNLNTSKVEQSSFDSLSGTVQSYGSSLTVIAQNISALFSTSGATNVGYGNRSVADKLGESISVKDSPWNAKGDNSSDDTTAFQAASLVASNAGRVLHVPQGTYKIKNGFTLSGQNTGIVGDYGTVINVVPDNQITFVIRLAPSNYAPLYVENITINCNYLAQYAILASQGSPKLRNVIMSAPSLHGVFLDMRADRADWIENFSAYNVLVNGAGSHPFHARLQGSGAWNGYPFFNETLIEQFEVRGIGTKVAGASAFRVTFDGITNAPVSGLTIIQSNLDAQVSGAVAPVSHTIYAQNVNGGNGRLESLMIKGGGWESTSGVAPAGLKNIECDSGTTIKISHVIGIVNYNWGYGVGNAFALEKTNYYADAAGAIYPQAVSDPNGIALKASSGRLDGFSNTPATYRNRDFLVVGGTKNIDIPIGSLSNFSISAPIYVRIYHQGFPDSLAIVGEGYYRVSLGRTTTNQVNSKIKDQDSTSPSSSFDPTAVTFSIPLDGILRVSIPGGANVGSGGANTAFDIAASRMQVGLPGLFSAISL